MNPVFKVCVIIPTYNEAKNIGGLIDEIVAAAPHVSILVVDDNSPDGTASVVEDKLKQYPQLSVLVRKGERGFAGAYKAGFAEVLQRGAVECIITMDADFSHNPRYIPDLLAAVMSGCDVAIGSRYVWGGGVLNWGVHRRFLSKCGNLYARTVLGLPTHDLTAGFLCIRTDSLKRFSLNDMHAEGYAWLMELKQLLYLSGAGIREIPIIFEERREGASKISRRIVFEGLIFPWRLRLRAFGRPRA
jgi:dolichol-phosphate mannosyltransferase